VEEPSEAELVRRLRQGEPAAFDEVYARFHAPLYAFLARLLGRRDLAQDLAQETWIRLATHASGLRPDTRLGAWLYTVARNLTLSFRRWSAFSGRRLALLHWRADAGDAVSPFDIATAGETQRRLEAALASLPAKYREVLLLVGVEGLPREDAAAILGLRADALRQRLARARAMIEQRLGLAEVDTADAPAGLPETSR
jgi:RNA polymerase sigma-70 factor (ECF subfamily)